MRGLVFAALLVAAAGASMSSIPLFVWSGHSNVQSGATSVKAALSTHLGGSEIAMVYMLDEVSSHQMGQKKAALTNLQDALQLAQSSTFDGMPLHKVNPNDILATARPMAASTANVKAADLQAYLSAHAELLSNGKPDVIVVNFPASTDLESVDAVVGWANRAVSAVTSKYVSILSSGNTLELSGATNLAFPFSGPSNARPSVAYGKSLLYGPTFYLTPTLLCAILVSLWMFFVAFCAYCCLLSLQTPEKFEGDQEKEMARALNQSAK